jgi:hypothetical protein
MIGAHKYATKENSVKGDGALSLVVSTNVFFALLFFSCFFYPATWNRLNAFQMTGGEKLVVLLVVQVS